jgi:hypothetical protein
VGVALFQLSVQFATAPRAIAYDDRLGSTELRRIRERLSKPAPSGLGFHCLKSSEGLECIGHLPSYPEKVAILVPNHFEPSPEGSRYVLHLLGYIDQKSWDHDLVGNLRFFGFLRALNTASEPSTLMVVPWTDERCATYESYFGTSPHSFDELMKSVAEQATGVEPKEITLTSHSGAFRSLNLVIAQAAQPDSTYGSRITSIGLFDTTYWPASSSLIEWASDSSHSVYNIYRDGSATADLSRRFDLDVKTRNLFVVPLEDTPISYHWEAVRHYYAEALSFLR